jgi:hypothetical protein
LNKRPPQAGCGTPVVEGTEPQAGPRSDSECEWQECLVDETESQEPSSANGKLGLRRDLLEKAMTHLNDRKRQISTERRLLENPTTLEDLSQQYAYRASACGRSRCALSKNCRSDQDRRDRTPPRHPLNKSRTAPKPLSRRWERGATASVIFPLRLIWGSKRPLTV